MSDPEAERAEIFISYSHRDSRWLDKLKAMLAPLTRSQTLNVWDDRRIVPGADWRAEIVNALTRSKAAILLVSPHFLASDFIMSYELPPLLDAARQRGLVIFWVYLSASLVEETGISRYQAAHNIARPLDSLSPPQQNQVIADICRVIKNSLTTASSATNAPINTPPSAPAETANAAGGALPLGSPYYIARSADFTFLNAVTRRESVVLTRGARQMGKSSLLALGLQAARETGARVALTDFQDFAPETFASAKSFLLATMDALKRELGAPSPTTFWDEESDPYANFRDYLRRGILETFSEPLAWGMDEVDRLFAFPWASQFFASIRALHNRRASKPDEPWHRLTCVMGHSTEPYLFIKDINMSPFNIGVSVELSDFTRNEAVELNRRYGSPLRNSAETDSLFALVNGHPYLTSKALYEVSTNRTPFDALLAHADEDNGPFHDHLRRLANLIANETEIREGLRSLLAGGMVDESIFDRLRKAGLVGSDTPHNARPRCELYSRYLKRIL